MSNWHLVNEYAQWAVLAFLVLIVVVHDRDLRR